MTSGKNEEQIKEMKRRTLLAFLFCHLSSLLAWKCWGFGRNPLFPTSYISSNFAIPLSNHPDAVYGPHYHPDLSKSLFNQLISSAPVQKLLIALPPTLKSILLSIYPADLCLFVFFQLSYSKLLKFAHRNQIHLWKLLALGTPYPWENSILGFAEERGRLLSKLLGGNYIIKLVCMALTKLGFRIRADFPNLLSSISYTLFVVHFIDLFKAQFMKTFFPNIAENRRQNYVVNRSASVIIWIIGGLVVCEMVSTYLKIPLSSTLAFGGVGGLAIGLSARDIAANFLGGMLLLFNEPFTPGDMVTFRAGNTEFIGRVERVGWGQTRIRGRDTRPTYIPNSHFVQTAVTNMERITHRKYEASVPVRFQDYAVLPGVIAKIKEKLRLIPKLDVLSMPFRISFVKIGTYYLEIEITVYFATKSIDEFLTLQQTANIEIIKAIKECGADLAYPMTVVQVRDEQLLSSLVKLGSALRSNPTILYEGEVRNPAVPNNVEADHTTEPKRYFTDENIQKYSENPRVVEIEKSKSGDNSGRGILATDFYSNFTSNAEIASDNYQPFDK